MNVEPFDIVLVVIIIGAFAICLYGLTMVIKEGFLKKWNLVAGFVFGALLVSYLVYNVISHEIDPKDWALIFLTLGLVMVTGLYALVAFRQANASMKMAEEMRNARSPSITIKWLGANPNSKEISTILENAGFGTALNLKCYLTHKEFNFNRSFCGYSTFDVGQKYTLTLPSESFDFKAWNGLVINCDYESILGEKSRSMLKCESQENRSMQIIKLNSEDKND